MHRIFFTADLHFNHKTLLRITPRGEFFRDIDEMNAAFISNMNETLGENDHLYILGDLGECKYPEGWATIFRSIRCRRINIIWGNHDNQNKVIAGCSILPEGKVNFLGDLHHLNMSGQQYNGFTFPDGSIFVLSHYPMYAWWQSFRGSFNLHGHIHGQYEKSVANRLPRQQDVGVDSWNYRPVDIKHLYDKLIQEDIVNI